MVKTIELREGVEITLANDTLWLEYYQAQFNKDVLNTLMPLLLSVGPMIAGLAEESGSLGEISQEAAFAVLGDPDRMLDIVRGFGAFDSTDIMHITWAMAKAYDENIPDHIKWQKDLAGPEHESLPIATKILPAITELMVKGVETSFWMRLTENAKKVKADLQPKPKKEKFEKITLNTIYLAGLERGLTKPDMQRMTVGEIVDFVKEYNERNKEQKEETGKKPAKKYRLATPQETSAYHRS